MGRQAKKVQGGKPAPRERLGDLVDATQAGSGGSGTRGFGIPVLGRTRDRLLGPQKRSLAGRRKKHAPHHLPLPGGSSPVLQPHESQSDHMRHI